MRREGPGAWVGRAQGATAGCGEGALVTPSSLSQASADFAARPDEGVSVSRAGCLGLTPSGEGPPAGSWGPGRLLACPPRAPGRTGAPGRPARLGLQTPGPWAMRAPWAQPKPGSAGRQLRVRGLR